MTTTETPAALYAARAHGHYEDTVRLVARRLHETANQIEKDGLDMRDWPATREAGVHAHAATRVLRLLRVMDADLDRVFLDAATADRAAAALAAGETP